jgi:outer membrane autotransporter protein
VSQPDPDDLDLDTDVDFTAPAALGAAGLLSPNRLSVGQAFDQSEVSNPTPGFSAVAQAIAALPSAPALAATYDSLSGASVVDALQVSFAAQQAYETRLLQQIGGSPGSGDAAPYSVAALGPVAPPVNGEGWHAWVSGFGGNDQLSGSGQASLATQTAGAMLGVEKWFTNALMAGVSIGGGTSSFSVRGQTSDGIDRSVNLGLFGLARRGPLYVSGVLSYGNFAVSQTRTGIGQLIGLNSTASSSSDANAFGGRFELGWQRPVGSVTITPFVAIEADGLWQGQVTEAAVPGAPTGASDVALHYDATSEASVPLTLGGRANWHLDLGGGRVLATSLQLGWVHEFNPQRSLTAAFAGAPGAPFRVFGVAASRDAAQTIAGASVSLSRTVSLFGSFTGQFSGVETSVGGFGGLRVNW